MFLRSKILKFLDGLKNINNCKFSTISMKKMSTASESTFPLIAVCQVCSTNNKEDNLKVCDDLIRQAKDKGAKMIFLPEAFDYIATSIAESVEMSEDLKDGKTINHYKNLSKKLDVWLSLGGFHQKAANSLKLKNSHVIIDNNGIIVGVYDKTHLFDVDINREDKKIRLKESDFTIPGGQIVAPIDTPVGKLGLSICYDLRFPELSLALAGMNADILTFPSAFTKVTGEAHWEVLLRNKAIENQCYVVAAAQTGSHSAKRESFGHSMIIDPWGKIVASCQKEIGIAVSEINLDYIKKVREELPVRQHKRHDLYQLNLTSLLPSTTYSNNFEFGTAKINERQIFFQTNGCVAFVNKKPVLPGHVLVAPMRKTSRLSDLNPIEIGELFNCVQFVQKAVETEYQASSSTIAIQDGVDAGQTISHLHVHVMPRKPGDFPKLDDVYVELENFDKKPTVRNEDEMWEEAARLRKRITLIKS